MEKSGLIESGCKVVISIQIQHGPCCYNFVGAVGREHLPSSEVGRDTKSLRTTGFDRQQITDIPESINHLLINLNIEEFPMDIKKNQHKSSRNR